MSCAALRCTCENRDGYTFQNVLKTHVDCFLSYNAFLLLCTVEVAG